MKKVIVILALFFTLSALLVGCNNSKDGNSNTDDNKDNAENKELKIEYYSDDQIVKEQTGNGNVELTLENKYGNKDRIKITLPEGEKYLFFNMDANVKEALIYVPDSVYEYEISNRVLQNMPETLAPNKPTTNATPTIKARIASKEDLSATKNIALNPYDTGKNETSFPHASAGNTFGKGNNPEFDPRCAIDGFTLNTGHGGYPVQSWGPDSSVPNDNLWYQIDFGREVEVSSVSIFIRADFPHDTYLKGAVLEFSDGTTKDITLEKKKEPQVIEIDNVKTNSVRIKDFDKAINTWVAFTEVEVYGKEAEVN